MTPARHWHGSRLVLGWIVAAVAFVALRWSLGAGVYRIAMENQRMERVGGMWPREFATLVTALGGVIALLVLAGLTASWLAGRRERAARRAQGNASSRRILM